MEEHLTPSKPISPSCPQKSLYFCSVLLAIAFALTIANDRPCVASAPNNGEIILETLQKRNSLNVGEFTFLKTKRRLSINETCSFYANASTQLNDWWNRAHIVIYFVNQTLFEQWKASPGTPLYATLVGGNDISRIVITGSPGYWYLIVHNDPEESDQSVDVFMSLTYRKIESNSSLTGFSVVVTFLGGILVGGILVFAGLRFLAEEDVNIIKQKMGRN